MKVFRPKQFTTLLLFITLTSSISITVSAQEIYVGRNGSFVRNGIKLTKEDMRRIYELNLSGQNLTSIPKDIKYFSELRELDISNNQIEELPEGFCSLYELRRLKASNNKIGYIHPRIFRLRELEEVYLSHNKLDSLPQDFFRLKNLEKLDLSHNQFSEISSEIWRLLELRYLNIAHNKFTRILPYLRQLYKLEKFDASGNDTVDVLTEEEQKMTFGYVSHTEPFTPDSGMVKITGQEKRVIVNPGQKLYLQNGAHGSVGIGSHIEIDTSKNKYVGVIELSGTHFAYRKPLVTGETGGDGGTRTFIFEALKAGKTRINITYYSPLDAHNYKRSIVVIVK